MILSKKRKFLFLFILFAGIFACLAMILPKSQRPPKVKIVNFPIPKQLIPKDTSYFAMYRNRGVQVKIILPKKQLKKKKGTAEEIAAKLTKEEEKLARKEQKRLAKEERQQRVILLNGAEKAILKIITSLKRVGVTYNEGGNTFRICATKAPHSTCAIGHDDKVGAGKK